MLVAFFSVRATNESTPIEALAMEFFNAPRYLPLEGGTGMNYLFCVNIADRRHVDAICKRHNYEVSTSYTFLEVNDNQYSPQYQAAIRYGPGDPYVLDPIS